MDGVLRCSRYAFGPNRLHFCGPDANKEIWEYVNDGCTDFGLQKLLQGFEVLYPYLVRIAKSNGLTDPFDPRVVDAYWLGNSLLDRVDKQALHDYFVDSLRVRDRVPIKKFRLLEDRIGGGLMPNHNFHIINVPKRMGHLEEWATPEYMDQCRISWGKVKEVSGPHITVVYEPLVEVAGKLTLGESVEKKLIRRLEADYDIEMLKPGEWLTMHWNIPTEVVTEAQVQKLRRYTEKGIALANGTH